jgi:Ca2+/H+ antiporter, TMEM165/GDT1 family
VSLATPSDPARNFSWIPSLYPNVKTHGNYGVFVLTVVTFFMAEMGDKTQIIALALAARYNSLAAVVAGTTLGMMIVNVPTVLFAERATKWVPVKVVRIVAALIYAILGVITLPVIHM